MRPPHNAKCAEEVKNLHGKYFKFLILMFTQLCKTQFIFDLRTFVANSALSEFRAFWGGTFGQNLVGGGTKTF